MFVAILSPECREGDRDVGVETDNPTLEDIDAALRALDGKSRTVVLLMASGPTHMGIACSLRGQYVVYATQDNNVYNYLIGDSSARGEVEMAVGGQVLVFEASWVVSLEPMLRAARIYAETGELDTSQRWVAVQLDRRMT